MDMKAELEARQELARQGFISDLIKEEYGREELIQLLMKYGEEKEGTPYWFFQEHCDDFLRLFNYCRVNNLLHPLVDEIYKEMKQYLDDVVPR